MDEALNAFIVQFAQNHPIILTILSVIGVLRAINKPIFALLHAYVLATPSTSDDALLSSVEQNKIVRALLFALDWTASIKLPPPQPPIAVLPKGDGQ